LNKIINATNLKLNACNHEFTFKCAVCHEEIIGHISELELKRKFYSTFTERAFVKEIICDCKKNYYRVYFVHEELNYSIVTNDISPKLIRVELEGAVENDEWAY